MSAQFDIQSPNDTILTEVKDLLANGANSILSKSAFESIEHALAVGSEPGIRQADKVELNLKLRAN